MHPADDDAHHRLRLELSGLPYRPLLPPAHHHLVVNGLRLHAVDWGARDAPPMVFLHGGGQTCRTWDVVCHELSTTHRCVAIDQRGHGDSEWSYASDYRPEAHARDIAGAAAALGLGPAVVVGMSMGCGNGLEYALTHPERVTGFVAVDAGPWIHVDGAGPIRDFMRFVASPRTFDELVDAARRL